MSTRRWGTAPAHIFRGVDEEEPDRPWIAALHAGVGQYPGATVTIRRFKHYSMALAWALGAVELTKHEREGIR